MENSVDNKKILYITTPIYYVNAEPHLGHAYSTIVADVFKRFHILRGYKTFFLTGTDEHGEKIVQAAEAIGQTPREYVDRISALFKGLWPRLNISYDYFIRTTDPEHKKTVQFVLNRIYEKGDIYFSEYEGLYCVGCERFYTKRELVDGKCPDHQKEPEVIREANYFFRMSKYQDWLVEYINNNPDFIRPERYRNEVLSFLKEPLEDLCISRPKKRLAWGIPLPFDEDFVTYVWCDALVNYLSGIGYPDDERFYLFWPHVQHVIAKDILKPHAIYWPCMLKAAGIEPYRHLNVHGYWNVEEGKMSKSLGNIISPIDVVENYGLDPFRYFLMREMVFGLDSDFNEDALVNRINADLANDLGNLVNRTLTMAERYLSGEPPISYEPSEYDIKIKEKALACIEEYERFMEGFMFHRALICIWDVIGALNKYIDVMAPWGLAKKDKKRLSTVMHYIIEPLKIISVLLWPFMPSSAERMQEMLGLEKRGKELRIQDIRVWGKTSSSHLKKGAALFPRIETKSVKEKREKKERRILEKEKRQEIISIDDFSKVELRIGRVLEAERVSGSKKLMKLRVDIGEERTIVAGIAESYSSNELVGKLVVVVSNLKPARIFGIESQGMLLAASDKSGIHIIVPDGDTKPGTKVK
ncbi:MAG: methionine--tRNA ligase [Deltaproteobacteria bacterium]|nr:MAG: methionine--tRNA ligase [Deltaproteobacteria bacterium]